VPVIYCVVPEPLTDDLLEDLTSYYSTDPNVTVLVDRRRSSRREGSIRAEACARFVTAAARASPASCQSSQPIDSSIAPAAMKLVVHVDGGARGNPGRQRSAS